MVGSLSRLILWGHSRHPKLCRSPSHASNISQTLVRVRCYSMVWVVLVATHRECTARLYYGSGHYLSDQGSSLCCYGDEPRYSEDRVFERRMRKHNNQGFGDCFSYKRLDVMINNSDFIISGLYLLISGSNSVCHASTTVETGLVCLV